MAEIVEESRISQFSGCILSLSHKTGVAGGCGKTAVIDLLLYQA